MANELEVVSVYVPVSRHVMADVYVQCQKCRKRLDIGKAPVSMVSLMMCKGRIKEAGWHWNVNGGTCPECRTQQKGGTN